MSPSEDLNIKLRVAYDGTDYIGWQDNGDGGAIETALKQALERIQRHPITLQAASRTDKGVHAVGQIVNFRTGELKKPLPVLVLSLNALLPVSIRVLEAAIMPPFFHPTLDVVGKEYHYRICHGPVQSPQYRWTSWHYPYALDYEEMQKAACQLIGNHDFAAFCYNLKAHSYPHTERTLDLAAVEPEGEQRLLLRFVGRHFLHKMVRILTGTLLFAGRGIIPSTSIKGLFSMRKRKNAGLTAPPHGLTLYRVFY